MHDHAHILQDASIINALIAGIVIAAVAGAIGCFVVWRRMAYFGDSLAHSALLGIALGFLLGNSGNYESNSLLPQASILATSLAFAGLLIWLQHKKILATDTLLGILAHGALSIGMVTLSVMDVDVDLHDYLFGDILSVTFHEIIWIYAGSFIIMLLLAMNWSSLVLMTIHEDIAMAENVRTFFVNLLFTLLITIIVAVSVRVIGMLLITSMLIIPAATARQFARSPEGMAISAAILGVIAMVIGVFGAVEFHTPSGPSIVAVSTVFFMLALPICALIKKVNCNKCKKEPHTPHRH